MNGVERRVFLLRPENYETAYGKGVLGMDWERYGISSEEEVGMGWRPPQSVAKVVVGKKGRSIQVQGHSQILRIRAEDSHLGEDIGEGYLRLRDGFGVATHFMLFSSRPILPASPLSGKTAH